MSSYPEDHLPRHMKLSGEKRVIRFLFGPIALLTMITLMRYQAVYKTISDNCAQRAQCYASCVQDNFPNLNCREMDYQNLEGEPLLEYNGNEYSNFFFYPKPAEHKMEHYNVCRDFIDINPDIEWTS